MLPRILLPFGWLLLARLSASTEAPTPIEQAAADVKAGEFIRAEMILEPLVKGRHADPEALYYMSRVRLAQKQFADAVDFADRASKGAPSKVGLLLNLGEICYATIPTADPMEGNSLAIKMRKSYEKVLKVDPDNGPAIDGLILFYEHAPDMVGGDKKKAVEYARRLVKVDPYLGEIELGRLAAGANDFEGALAHYDTAVKIHPNDLATATASGWSLYKMNRKKEARERFEGVLRTSPDFGPAKMGLDQIVQEEQKK